MGERKVVSKYYSYDFNHKLLKKPKPRTDQIDKVRMMLPFTVRCFTCSAFLHIGKKFNMRKESVQDHDYLGIEILRFYFKCSCWASELTMRTDPKNSDYIIESGGSRNYDVWKDMDIATQAVKDMKEEEKEDPVKFWEMRAAECKREMELQDSIERIQDMNKVHAVIDHEKVVAQALQRTTSFPSGITYTKRIDEEAEHSRIKAAQIASSIPSLPAKRPGFSFPKNLIKKKKM